MQSTFLKKLGKAVIVSIGMLTGTANAGLISAYGYTLNTDTDIVTGGGLEWLQWDVTTGMPLQSVLDANGIFNGRDYGRGWELATNVQAISLFDAFGFPTNSEGESSLRIEEYQADSDDSVMDKFIELFGTTDFREGGDYGTGFDAFTLTQAIHSFDDTKDGMLYVRSDYTYDSQSSGPVSLQTHTLGPTNLAYDPSTWGVALVRNIEVPAPTTITLFGLGILGLVLRRRRV